MKCGNSSVKCDIISGLHKWESEMLYGGGSICAESQMTKLGR